jgi:hypothetical protein
MSLPGSQFNPLARSNARPYKKNLLEINRKGKGNSLFPTIFVGKGLELKGDMGKSREISPEIGKFPYEKNFIGKRLELHENGK